MSFSINQPLQGNCLQPHGIDIIRKAQANIEIKKKFEPIKQKKETTQVDKTFTEALLHTLSSDPIDKWKKKKNKFPDWVTHDYGYRRYEKNFGTYVLDEITYKMREITEKLNKIEKKNAGDVILYHATLPNYGFVYTVQTHLKKFLNIHDSKGVWCFRWDHSPSDSTIESIAKLIKTTLSQNELDESGVFRDHAFCGTPSIFTNFGAHSESAAEIWFSSKPPISQHDRAGHSGFIFTIF